jgi:hypothetical protein
MALFGVIFGTCYITQEQILNFGGFNFHAIRIVLLAALVRIFAYREHKGFSFNKIDWAVMAFVVTSTVAPILRLGVWKEQVGGAYNIFFSYFVFRCLIKSHHDLEESLPYLALLILPLAVCMCVESASGQNIFRILMGGTGEIWEREGRFRCIGSFRGPHTAGIFGATMMPFFLRLFGVPGQRHYAILGMVGSILITYTSNSSGPLMGFLSCLVGMSFWRMRFDMRKVRRGLVLGLLILDAFMKAPIWYVFAKVSDITGGDGWSRSYLMEQCFNHVKDWWLLGTDNTAPWASADMPWGGADLCNLYVSCAAGGGLASLVLMILILVYSFSLLGKSLQIAREKADPGERIFWCLGCVLFAHVNTQFSVSYFDQLHVVWWGLIAIISSVTSSEAWAPAQEVANERGGFEVENSEDLAFPAVSRFSCQTAANETY